MWVGILIVLGLYQVVAAVRRDAPRRDHPQAPGLLVWLSPVANLVWLAAIGLSLWAAITTSSRCTTRSTPR